MQAMEGQWPVAGGARGAARLTPRLGTRRWQGRRGRRTPLQRLPAVRVTRLRRRGALLLGEWAAVTGIVVGGTLLLLVTLASLLGH
jgi:hypothetical protein